MVLFFSCPHTNLEDSDIDFKVKFFKKIDLHAKLLAFSYGVMVVHVQLNEVDI